MVDREKDAFDAREKTIMNLQDQIKLLEFDVADSHVKISGYKTKVKQARKTITKVKETLVDIKKTENYERLNEVLCMLRDVGSDE